MWIEKFICVFILVLFVNREVVNGATIPLQNGQLYSGIIFSGETIVRRYSCNSICSRICRYLRTISPIRVQVK